MTRPSTYLLRLRVPDEPGVLGRVASALGSTGADIDSIVVVDRAPGYAVDDLVVSLPAEALADRLVSAASAVPHVVVEALQRHHGRLRLHDDLALLDDAAVSSQPLVTLTSGLPELLHASYAMVVGLTADGGSHTIASSASAPEASCRPQWLPLAAVRAPAVTEVWTDPAVAGPDCELAAAPFRDDAVLLARIGGPEFLPAELTRLAHLARVAQALLPSSENA